MHQGPFDAVSPIVAAHCLFPTHAGRSDPGNVRRRAAATASAGSCRLHKTGYYFTTKARINLGSKIPLVELDIPISEIKVVKRQREWGVWGGKGASRTKRELWSCCPRPFLDGNRQGNIKI